MEKAHEFDFYFTDERLSPEIRERMQLTRQLVHELYPEVQERVAYAMPGFYPKNAKKANQQLFYLMNGKNWLGIYGTGDLTEDETVVEQLAKMGVEVTAGSTKVRSLHVPYELAEEKLKVLLQLIMRDSFLRNGLELMHDKGDFSENSRR